MGRKIDNIPATVYKKRTRIINAVIIWAVALLWAFDIFLIAAKVFFEAYDLDFPYPEFIFDALFVVGVGFVAAAVTGVVLLLKRKRAGWMILVAFTIVGITQYAHMVFVKILGYYDSVRELAEYSGGYDDELRELLMKTHRLAAMSALTVAAMCAVVWLFIRRKSLREIYNIGSRTIVYTLCGAAAIFALDLAISKNFFRSAETSTRITQLPSDEQVVVNYDKKRDRVSSVTIPLTFEYHNLSLKRRGFSRHDEVEYRQNDWESYGRYPTEWNSHIWCAYKIDGKLESTGHYDLSPKRRFIDLSGRIELVVMSRHRIDTAGVVQAAFGPYIDRMKQAGTDTLSVGTPAEFALRHSELAEKMFEGDSIRFNIENRWHKWEATITLPLKDITGSIE